MEFNPDNKIVKLCAEGMHLEGAEKQADALALYRQAWEEAENDFEKFTAAHYVARHQQTVSDKLKWDTEALKYALKINNESVKATYPSLHLNIARCHEDLNDPENAARHYDLADQHISYLPDDGYGNMIAAGIKNGRQRIKNHLKAKDYTYTITLKNTSIEKVYEALTRCIPEWWTEMFEGKADKTEDVFTVRFGGHIFKTIRIEALLHNSEVIWYVADSLINIPELKNQTEWIGTTISWELTQKQSDTILRLTHIGLRPGIACYEICINGWQQFTDSLKLFIETGRGNPFKL